ncbi:amidophosphoribosyltransferase [Syntrophus aciditrophicus]|uniref:Amidophosphoribosyltransferase n=1 Tax=Syntrophus aciditrophicus (strain SB) TaxID=56780 RepID=Q2LTR9_SYNAS|nr:amidophosphoribosyltransferase [Syntrophus aciditrophicus]ABC77479.1 amidophosphoribosyltransferase [Syntrophus aciditrophicus SB]
MGGLFGVVSKGNCIKPLFYGTDYHSHLGTENGGLAVIGEKSFHKAIHSISQAQFKSKFIDHYRQMRGTAGIGAIDDESPQPLIIRSKFGTFAIAASGLVTNKDRLAHELLQEGTSFSEVAGGAVNTVDLVAKLISRSTSLVEGIVQMQEVIEGSICVLILTSEGLYAARDKYGRFPLALGRERDGDGYAVATESSSFPNLNYELVKFIGPGEIVLMTADGYRTLRPENPEKKVCAFLWIYTGTPSSSYEGISVENAREHCGRALAREDSIAADLVCGIPDSGVGHALGYAAESRIPYRRPLVKYTPGYGRSYTPPTQDIRDLVATMKLSAIRDVIKDNRMIVCDDSIVRGTQLKNYTIKKLWDNGAREIHIRAACPPLMFTCPYGSSTRSLSELAARRAIRAIEGKDPDDVAPYLDCRSAEYARMVEWIRKDLNVTTLKYLNIESMIEAIGLSKDQLCLHCWRGH